MRRLGIGVVLIAVGCSGPARPADPARRTPAVPSPGEAPARTASIHAGWCHACVLDAAGGLACWGCNDKGQLGDGTTEDRATPVPVAGIAKVSRVALGAETTCAIDDAGRVTCWGANDHLQLGQSGEDSPVPARVPNVDDAVDITVGRSVACALERGGALYCWGENRYWDTGPSDYGDQVATRIDRALELDVTGVRVDTGNNACVRDRAGTVSCWGPDLGNWDIDVPSSATNEERQAAHSALGSPVVRATGIRTFLDHTAPVCIQPWDTDGGAWSCLGAPNDPSPHVDAGPVRGQLAIAGSGGCAASGGRVQCWGRADDPMVGIGAVEQLADVVQVAAGGGFACALRETGAIACWGSPRNWRTGDAAMALSADPPAPPEAAPRKVPAEPPQSSSEPDCRITAKRTVQCRERGNWRTMARVRDVVQLSYGDSHVCARADGGAVWCWGAYYYDSYSHDGEYTEVPRPHRIRELSAMTILSWGERDCAVDRSNGIVCWGRGISEVLEPVPVHRPPDTTTALTHLSVSDDLLCGWQPGIEGWCWPTYDLIQRRGPLPRFAIASPVSLELAGERGCALHDDGTASCWGKAIAGDGTWAEHAAPVPVSGITDATALSVSFNHACVLTGAGAVWCWGENGDGQLGDGTTRDRIVPVRAKVADGLGTITSVMAYDDATGVVTAGGDAFTWGKAE